MDTDNVVRASSVSAFPVEADVSHASREVVEFFVSFFGAKNSHDVGATMGHFSPQVVTYTDSTLGWPFDGWDILHGVLSQYMPQWPDTALSYPTRILGDGHAGDVRRRAAHPGIDRY